jgi:hypothetical protein
MSVEPERFEQAIANDPENAQLYQMLADALLEAGDEFGECIANHLRLTSATWRTIEDRDPQLKALLARLREFVGPAARHFSELRWQWGFVEEAKLDLLADTTVDLTDCFERRVFRFLRMLTVRLTNTNSEALEVAPLVPGCATLKRLKVESSTPCEVGDFSRVWAKLPALSSLTLLNAIAQLGSVPRQLRALTLVDSSRRQQCEPVLLEAPWPQLRTLRVSLSPSDTLAALTPSRMPALRELTLEAQRLDDLLLQARACALLPQLETLKCDAQWLSDSGLEALRGVLAKATKARIEVVGRDTDNALDMKFVKRLRENRRLNLVIDRYRPAGE